MTVLFYFIILIIMCLTGLKSLILNIVIALAILNNANSKVYMKAQSEDSGRIITHDSIPPRKYAVN